LETNGTVEYLLGKNRLFAVFLPNWVHYILVSFATVTPTPATWDQSHDFALPVAVFALHLSLICVFLQNLPLRFLKDYTVLISKLLQVLVLSESFLILLTCLKANGLNLLLIYALPIAIFAVIGMFLLKFLGFGHHGRAHVVYHIFFEMNVMAIATQDFAFVGGGVRFLTDEAFFL
jgi:hypothetical protein